jgi:hypothetical protein
MQDFVYFSAESWGVFYSDGDSEDPFMTLYNSVRMYADYSGRILSEAFMRLPSKRYTICDIHVHTVPVITNMFE